MSSEITLQTSLRPKSQRILACVLCQQRKIKCDRQFPCHNCIKIQAQCVPSTLAKRQRRRRFPERDLLERIRKYESLLRHNDIPFKPLHKDVSGDREVTTASQQDLSEDEQVEEQGQELPTLSATVKSEGVSEAKYALMAHICVSANAYRNIWHAMTQGVRQFQPLASHS